MKLINADRIIPPCSVKELNYHVGLTVGQSPAEAKLRNLLTQIVRNQELDSTDNASKYHLIRRKVLFHSNEEAMLSI